MERRTFASPSRDFSLPPRARRSLDDDEVVDDDEVDDDDDEHEDDEGAMI